MTDHQRDCMTKAFQAMSDYLHACGWASNEDYGSESTMFYRIDPKTGLAHRQDFAFFIQTERDCNETLSEPTESQPKDEDTIEDGFGMVCSAWCQTCKQKTMSIVRPGQVQCDNCGH